MPTKLGKDKYQHPIQAVRPSGTTQTVAYTDSSVATTNAVSGSISVVRLLATTDCHYVMGSSPSANANVAFLPANVVEYVRVDNGDKIAFIRNSANGTAYITECD